MHLFCFCRRVSQNGFAEKVRWGKNLNIGSACVSAYFIFCLSLFLSNYSEMSVVKLSFYRLLLTVGACCSVAILLLNFPRRAKVSICTSLSYEALPRH